MTPARIITLALSWAWLLLFSIVPLGIILVIALARPADTVPPFSFAADPGNFAIAATDELYRTAFWLSLRTAAVSTVICLLIGYPMALAIAARRRAVACAVAAGADVAVLDRVPDAHQCLDRHVA